jgi:hypothetical protein
MILSSSSGTAYIGWVTFTASLGDLQAQVVETARISGRVADNSGATVNISSPDPQSSIASTSASLTSRLHRPDRWPNHFTGSSGPPDPIPIKLLV